MFLLMQKVKIPNVVIRTETLEPAAIISVQPKHRGMKLT